MANRVCQGEHVRFAGFRVQAWGGSAPLREQPPIHEYKRGPHHEDRTDRLLVTVASADVPVGKHLRKDLADLLSAPEHGFIDHDITFDNKTPRLQRKRRCRREASYKRDTVSV